MKRLLLSALLGVGLFGCAPKEVNYSVKIVTQNCDPSANPFEGVQFLRVRVTGTDMAPLTATSAANAATPEIKIPEIPAGNGRVIEVRAYENDPASGGRVVSIGKSVAFNVPDVVPEDLMGAPINVNVILRKVNSFAPIVSAAAPTTCQALRVPRAGHTATLLKSGKVFIVGGYNFKAGTAEKKALADAEIYNPSTGAFELAKPISIGAVGEFPRAYHTATLLQNGQVLIWGGESYGNGVNNTPNLWSQVFGYDEGADEYGIYPGRVPPAAPVIVRSHHRAAIDKNGKVLVAGGYTRSGSLIPADAVEWLDPATATSDAVKVITGVQLPRIDPTVMPLKQGEFIAVAGGSDSSSVKTDITFFKFDGTTFGKVTPSTPPQLSGVGRRGAAGANIRDGMDLIILGGFSSSTMVAPLGSSEILSSSTTISPGPNDVGTARGEICAVTLADGRVLAVGGRTSDSGAPARSDATAVMITAAETGGVTSESRPALPKARYHHTCTALNDGTVLVTGGINEFSTGGNQTFEILQDAYIYTPTPLTD